MMVYIKVIRICLSIAIVVVFLGILLSSVDMLLIWGHKNATMLAISRWTLSSSRCSDVAVGYLQTAERHILLADKNRPDHNICLLNRVRHFQRICELAPPVEDIYRFTFDLNSLPYQELEQPLPGVPQWILKSYWVDESAIELNEEVLVVLKWEVTDPEILYSLPEERQAVRAQDTLDERWRIWRDGDAIVQVGKARNLVRNGGFEWYNFLAVSGLPTYYTTNLEGRERVPEFFYLDTTSALSSIPMDAACLKGQEQFYAGLYQLIPVAEKGDLFLQGALVRTEGSARADVGGSWETRVRRHHAFAARRVDTYGEWISYAQLIVSPLDTYQFTFRVANSGNTGTACFDNVFVVLVIRPESIGH